VINLVQTNLDEATDFIQLKTWHQYIIQGTDSFDQVAQPYQEVEVISIIDSFRMS
jgi:hypothetical protein